MTAVLGLLPKLKPDVMKRIFLLSLLYLIFYSANATVYVVNVLDGVFDPDTLQVQVGDTIRWYKDAQSVNPHTTTSVNIPAGAIPWNQGIGDSTPTFDYPVLVAGSYNYTSTIAMDDSLGMDGYFLATPWAVSLGNEPEYGTFMSAIVGEEGISITLNMDKAEPVVIQLYDLQGRLINTILNGTQPAGEQQIVYSTNRLPEGIYFLAITTRKEKLSEKLIL